MPPQTDRSVSSLAGEKLHISTLTLRLRSARVWYRIPWLRGTFLATTQADRLDTTQTPHFQSPSPSIPRHHNGPPPQHLRHGLRSLRGASNFGQRRQLHRRRAVHRGQRVRQPGQQHRVRDLVADSDVTSLDYCQNSDCLSVLSDALDQLPDCTGEDEIDRKTGLQSVIAYCTDTNEVLDQSASASGSSTGSGSVVSGASTGHDHGRRGSAALGRSLLRGILVSSDVQLGPSHER
ncbi:hypothetical protein GQ600_27893 [Phytophthora cactorum]|nr:hypothetical protein GQ600_27893 [Phytophthora cactorum]